MERMMTSLMDKKIVDLTAEEILSLTKPIGIEGLPYPMAIYRTLDKNEKDDKGKVVAQTGDTMQEIGVIDSLKDSMKIYSERSLEEIQGKLFREMPIPSMLLMLRNLLAKQAPTSKNRIFTVFGDPAFGKSFLFKSVSSIVHPQGAIQVDCGGMNMREIFFRTVIDYGSGVKEEFERRLAEGKIAQSTIDYLNEQFPDSVVARDGKSVVDWDRVGARKTDEEGDKAEDRGAAFERAAKVLSNIYDRENITHLNNSFGIKTVPGEFFEALWSGRPLFLDEFNKSKRGTLDSWQTALQFLNGEEDSVTIYNPMSQSAGDEATKAITVTRADLKPGFIVGVAGNEGKDGDTTQELSASMMTRLNPMYVGNPTPRDWEHRISQVWTGLPLMTLYRVFNDFALEKPEEFTQFLLDLRKMGLDDRQVAAIPAREIYFLQHWQETVVAVADVAKQQHFRFQLADTESKLYDKAEYKNLSDEISSDAAAKQIAVSFRKIIDDCNKAIEGMAEAHEPRTGLRPDIRQAFNPSYLSGAGFQEPAWHNFGANLTRAMIEDIINVTKDMPQVRKALIRECKDNHIIQEAFREAQASEEKLENMPISRLMKYDALKDIGGTDELRAIQSVVIMALRARYEGLEAPDDQLVPLETLGRVMKAFEAESKFNEAAGAETSEVIIPNDNLDQVAGQPVIAAQAVHSYNAGAAQDLMDFRFVLSAMAMPDYAEQNREKIWLEDLMDVLSKNDQLPSQMEESELEIYNTLMGKSKYGFNLAIASAADAEGKPAYLYVLEDKIGGQTLIVGPEKIPAQLDTVLHKNNVTYLVKSDNATKDKINKFLEDATRSRQDQMMPQATSNEVTETLINAFGRVSEVPEKYINKEGNIISETSFGSIIVDAQEAPSLYTQFVRKPKLVK
jgi:hypothetical protein